MHCYDVKAMRTLGRVGAMHNNFTIMLALCLMLFSTYYAHNYTGIIGTGLSREGIIESFKQVA